MCRCADRRTAVMRVGAAVLKGDVRTVVAQAGFVVRTSAEDAAIVARRAAQAAAHARLKRR